MYPLHWYTQSYNLKNANTSAVQAYSILCKRYNIKSRPLPQQIIYFVISIWLIYIITGFLRFPACTFFPQCLPLHCLAAEGNTFSHRSHLSYHSLLTECTSTTVHHLWFIHLNNRLWLVVCFAYALPSNSQTNTPSVDLPELSIFLGHS